MTRFSVLFFLWLMGCICDSYEGYLRWFLGVLEEWRFWEQFGIINYNLGIICLGREEMGG